MLNWSHSKYLQSALTTELATPEKQYHNILSQKLLSPSFFKDSVEHKRLLKDSSEKKSEESSSSFKLNRENCLDIFNSIQQFNAPFTSPQKRKYYGCLELINEHEESSSNQLRPTKKDEKLLWEEPPQTLKDIFNISNRNRKKNKQKKKGKHDSYSGDSDSSGRDQVETVHQIVNNQYRQDTVEDRNKENKGNFYQ